nr:ethylene-responsive transcription factor 3-like [Ipomoea trifida]
MVGGNTTERGTVEGVSPAGRSAKTNFDYLDALSCFSPVHAEPAAPVVPDFISSATVAQWLPPPWLTSAAEDTPPRSEYTGYKLETVVGVVTSEREKQLRTEKKPLLFDLNSPPPLL